jgi:hypothetical protein
LGCRKEGLKARIACRFCGREGGLGGLIDKVGRQAGIIGLDGREGG